MRILSTGLLAAATAALTAATAAAAPTTDSAALRAAITVDALRGHLETFQAIAEANGGNRAYGTPGYQASVKYVRDLLIRAGYRVSEQKFLFPFFQDVTPPEFVRQSPRRRVYEANVEFASMTYSDSGSASGQLIPAGGIVIPATPTPSSASGCVAADYTPAPSPGAIALIQRGTCTFFEKATLARAAGYSGAVIFNEGNPGRTDLFGGTLGEEVPGIYVISTSFAIGAELVELAARGPVRARVEVDSISENRITQNVLAETPFGDPERIVQAGAHLDSVLDSPGINDDSTGVAAILETALQMKRLGIRTRNKIIFSFWGAEEYGLFGSIYYVGQLSPRDRRRIKLYLNFDVLGSRNHGHFVYDGDGSSFEPAGPDGSDVIEDAFVEFFDSVGLGTAPTDINGGSDHVPFLAAGIPAGGLFSGASDVATEEEAELFGATAGEPFDECVNAFCDEIDRVNVEGTKELTDGAAHVILTFARAARLPGDEPGAMTLATQAAGTAPALDLRRFERLGDRFQK